MKTYKDLMQSPSSQISSGSQGLSGVQILWQRPSMHRSSSEILFKQINSGLVKGANTRERPTHKVVNTVKERKHQLLGLYIRLLTV